MAFYSPLELKEILIKLLQEPVNDKLITFERLGVLVNNRKDPEDGDVVPDEDNNQLYACSVCKKKLISAHLLDLHVVENHDTYFELQKDKKPMVSEVVAHCTILNFRYYSSHVILKSASTCPYRQKIAKITA